MRPSISQHKTDDSYLRRLTAPPRIHFFKSISPETRSHFQGRSCMSSRPFVKLQDRVGSIADVSPALAAGGLLGTWVNTDPDRQRLTRAVVERGPGPTGLALRATGPCVEGLSEWGPIPIDTFFASTPEGREA